MKTQKKQIQTPAWQIIALAMDEIRRSLAEKMEEKK